MVKRRVKVVVEEYDERWPENGWRIAGESSGDISTVPFKMVGRTVADHAVVAFQNYTGERKAAKARHGKPVLR